jgi:hypothetical protein
LDPKALGLPGGSALIEVIALDLNGDGRDSPIAVWATGGDPARRSYSPLR